MNRSLCLWLSVLLCLMASPSFADTFGNGENAFEIEFVTIGNPGNPPDENPNPAGAVPYAYRIGKYEIPEDAVRKVNAQSALDGAPLGLTLDMRGPNKPATSITWYEAAHFVNWLNTSSGNIPAYKFDAAGAFQLWLPTDPGYDADNLYRNTLAKYFLPSLNEWHKAAYYDPVAGHYWDYPTGSDAIPDGIDFVGDPNFDAVFYDGAFNPDPNDVTSVGLLSPFGIAGEGGNVAEWEETAFDRRNNIADEGRHAAGGSWGGGNTLLAAWNTGIGDGPQFAGDFIGIRVASAVPEPPGILTFALALLGLLRLGRRSKAA